MSGYKYSCPYCNQHIEYTDGYAGQRMPCPMCQQSIVFPAIPAGLKKSSLHLVRDIPKPVQQTHFSFTGILSYLAQHWKVVGTCLVPFGILAGVMISTSSLRHTDPPPAPPPAPSPAQNTQPLATADIARSDAPPPLPHTLPLATQQMQAQVTAVRQAATALKTAEQKKTAIHLQYANSPNGADYEQAADATVLAAQQNLTTAKATFTNDFANYQRLGGTTDYRRSLP